MAENTAKKQRGKPFEKGQSGNPTGRPKGSRNKATEAALALMEGQLETITQTVINAALSGDMTAIKLIMDKVLPPCRERALPSLSLPSVVTVQDLPLLSNAIIEATVSGELTPSEGIRLATLAERHGKVMELCKLEKVIEQKESYPTPAIKEFIENLHRERASE